MTRSVKLDVGEFGRTAIDRQAHLQGLSRDEFLALAAHYFLEDPDPGRLARQVPCFASEGNGAEPMDVELGLDGRTWSALEEEGRRLGLPVQSVLEHAALYLIADLDSGLVAARIANDG